MRFERAGRGGRRRAVVADPRSGLRRHREVGAVVPAVDAEAPGRAWPDRCRAQLSRRDAAARGAHRGDARDRRERAQQHRGAFALIAADRVRAPVHAVGEVHVQMAGRTEHRGVAGGRAPVGVARRVVGPEVRLDLDDAPAAGAAYEDLVEQIGRDLASVTPVEVTVERLQRDSASRTSAGTGVGVFFFGTTLT